MNSLWFLSSLPDASGKSLLRKLGFRYMLSPMVAYTSRIIMQAIPARVIARRTSRLVCRWASLARTDSPVNFGGTETNARSRIGILAGLLLVLKRILPIVMYPSQAFFSPAKLVRSVWSDIPMMGTTVDPAGKAFYRGKE